MPRTEGNIAKLRISPYQEQVKDTRGLPFRAICHLEIVWGDRQITPATGILFGQSTVITVGHNLYRRDGQGWARKITVTPGANGASAPFGSVEVGPRDLGTHPAWQDPRSYDYQADQNDLGAIWLPRPMNALVGWSDLTFTPDPEALRGQEMVSCGYPYYFRPPDRPIPPRTLWMNYGRFEEVGSAGWFYKGFAQGGLSGSPIWLKWQTAPYINTIALHKGDFTPTGGGERRGIAMRLRPDHYDLIQQWTRMARAPLDPSVEREPQGRSESVEGRKDPSRSPLDREVETELKAGRGATWELTLSAGDRVDFTVSAQATSSDAHLGRCSLTVSRKRTEAGRVEMFINTSGRQFNKQTLSIEADAAGVYTVRLRAHEIALRTKLRGRVSRSGAKHA